MSNTKPTPYGFAIIAHGVFQKFVRRDDVAAEVLAQYVASDPKATAIPLHTADALATQAAEIANLKTVMIAAAEEISAHWESHCDADGYGPANLMRRLEDGIPSEYGYTAGAFAKQSAIIAEQATQIEALRADAERWRYAVTHCEWRRTDNEDGRYSMLVVRLPYDADQSCVAMRNHAIDAAMQSGKAVTP